MRNLLTWINQTYEAPTMIITENGFADNGTLNDSSRISFYQVCKLRIKYNE